MPAAAASAPPSTERSPSTNGPVPRRQTSTPNVRAAPTTCPHAPTLRLMLRSLCARVLLSDIPGPAAMPQERRIQDGLPKRRACLFLNSRRATGRGFRVERAEEAVAEGAHRPD